MFWLITAIATFGAAGVSLFATLNRMGGNVERAYRTAPELPAAAFAEGAYGRITGIASSSAKLPLVPGLGIPCVAYELVVHAHDGERDANMGWRIVHGEVVSVELDVTVGDTVVRVNAREVYLVTAPSHDANRDLRPNGAVRGHSSRVRYIPAGATIHVVGTLTREVDDDPTAPRDYRSIATRYRLIGKRGQAVALAVAEPATT